MKQETQYHEGNCYPIPVWQETNNNVITQSICHLLHEQSAWENTNWNLMKQVFKYNETPFKKYQVTENQLIIVMSLNAKKADGKVSEDWVIKFLSEF